MDHGRKFKINKLTKNCIAVVVNDDLKKNSFLLGFISKLKVFRIGNLYLFLMYCDL